MLGFLADNVGIADAFLLVPVLLALATTALLAAGRLARPPADSLGVEPIMESFGDMAAG